MRNTFTIALAGACLFLSSQTFAQHTFSIVAFDPVTGETGSAGATCLDSLLTNGFDAYAISGIIPGTGSINAQALLQEQNLENGLEQMANGLNAEELIDWLVANDVNGTPESRQYGVVTFDGTNVLAAGFTGEEAFDYKDHIVGPNYAIQGNILIGPEVLEDMERNFLNCDGSLADKLMYALQGAKIPGADARCLAEGISSQSAFIRVAKADDDPGDLWMDLRVASRPFGIDPIDSLQNRFDVWKAANDPDTNDLGVIAIVSPQTGEGLTPNEQVRIEVANFGLSDQTGYEVGFIFNGAPASVEQRPGVLQGSSTSLDSFGTTVDMSAFGDYAISAFARANSDELNCNDTFSIVVSHLARVNAGIGNLSGLESGACGNSFPITFQLTNHGLDLLENAKVTVTLNGQEIFDTTWTGALALGQSTTLGFDLVAGQIGPNDLTITCSDPNGSTDQVMDNNTISTTYEYSGVSDYVLFELRTDAYPDETFWSIFDEDSNVVASGGNYLFQQSLYNQNICLQTNSCYTFTIIDLYGDGICCVYGNGFYRLSTESGGVLIEGGEFGFEESMDFCLGTVSTRDFSEETSITVSPNPFGNTFAISIESDQSLNDLLLQLHDPSGRLVYQSKHNTNGASFNEMIDAGSLNPGAYFLTVTSEGQSRALKVFKMD